MTKAIYIPGCYKWVSLGDYVKAWKTVKSVHPETVFKHRLKTWTQGTAKQLHKEFIEGLHDRINLRGEGLIPVN